MFLNVSSVFFNQGKNIIVFYGSQTGTGEEFANRLSKDAQRYGMKGMAADPEEYDMVICMWSNIRIRPYSFYLPLEMAVIGEGVTNKVSAQC